MRRAIVTGGESGLGAATATRLRADGVEVISFDLGGSPDFVVDVSDSAAVDAALVHVGMPVPSKLWTGCRLLDLTDAGQAIVRALGGAA